MPDEVVFTSRCQMTGAVHSFLGRTGCGVFSIAVKRRSRQKDHKSSCRWEMRCAEVERSEKVGRLAKTKLRDHKVWASIQRHHLVQAARKDYSTDARRFLQAMGQRMQCRGLTAQVWAAQRMIHSHAAQGGHLADARTVTDERGEEKSRLGRKVIGAGEKDGRVEKRNPKSECDLAREIYWESKKHFQN